MDDYSMYPRIKKKFTLYKVELTPNYAVTKGYLLFCVDIRHEEDIPIEPLLKVAKEHFSFWRDELKVEKIIRLGKLIGFQSQHGSFALRKSDTSQVTIHILDYANGEY